MLRAVGATEVQVLRMVLTEALPLAAILLARRLLSCRLWRHLATSNIDSIRINTAGVQHPPYHFKLRLFGTFVMAGCLQWRTAVTGGGNGANGAKAGILDAAENTWVKLIQIFGSGHYSRHFIQVTIID